MCPSGTNPKRIHMARIVILDDDYASEILVEHLGYRGHEVRRLTSADEALQDLKVIAQSDLLVLDIIMARSPSVSGGEISGGRNTGLTIFQNVRKLSPKLPILAYSATSDLDVIALLRKDPHTTFVPKWSAPTLDDVISRIDAMLGLHHERILPRPFIVHGHDEATKLAVKNYLQNTLKLPEPIILHEQPSLGRTIIEKFEHYAAQSQIAFVLLTPDDKAALVTAPNDEKRRARQNVVLELGFFLGSLGRSSGRVFLLYKGPLEIPGDLSGVCYIDISQGIEAVGESVRRELQHVL